MENELVYDKRFSCIVNRGRVQCDTTEDLVAFDDGVFIVIGQRPTTTSDSNDNNDNNNNNSNSNKDESKSCETADTDNAAAEGSMEIIESLIKEKSIWDVKGDKTELTNIVLVCPACGMTDYPIPKKKGNTRLAETITQINGDEVEIEMHKQCVKALGKGGLSQVMTDIYLDNVSKFGNYLQVHVDEDGKVTHQLKRQSRMKINDIDLSSYINKKEDKQRVANEE